MKKILSFVVLTLLFISSIKAQEGFRIEVGVGPTTGDSSKYHSYTLQGNFYYLWNTSKNIDLGLTSGALVFLKGGDIPEVYIPIAIAGRINLSQTLSIGSDIGYDLLTGGYSDGGGFYFRPIITYKLKEKFAIIGSYAHISENGGNASTINLGVNFGF